MEKEFEIFRANLKDMAKQVGQKTIIERSGISQTVLTLLLSGKRTFKQNHLEALSRALGMPLSKLFMSTSQVQAQIKTGELMREIQECIELMLAIPEFKRGILARADELKVTFREQVAHAKKAELQPHSVLK